MKSKLLVILPAMLFLVSWSGPWDLDPSADVSGKRKAAVYVQQNTKDAVSGQISGGFGAKYDLGAGLVSHRNYATSS